MVINMKMSAFSKDIIRTLKNNIARFIAITVMATLGMGVFSGFSVGCKDVIQAADDFYHKQNNYDIQVVSTLGLTHDDLEALASVPGVTAAFGNVSMDVQIELTEGSFALASFTTLDEKGMNRPYLLKGTLPEEAGQIAVDSKFIEDFGLNIGDSVTLSAISAREHSATDEENTEETDFAISPESDSGEPELVISEYKITAIVLNPLDISNSEGAMASSSPEDSKYSVYAPKNCVKSDIYTGIYLTVDGADKFSTYSKEYENAIQKISSRIKSTVQDKYQQARYDQVVNDANAKIADAQKILADKMDDAEQKMSDAQQEIDDGWVELNKGKTEIKSKEDELLSGEKKLKEALITADTEFAAAQKKIDDGWAELNAGEADLNSKKESAFNKFAEYEQKIADSQALLNTQKADADSQFSGMIAALPASAQSVWGSEPAQTIWAGMILNGKQAAPYLVAVNQGETPTKDQTDKYSDAMAKVQANTQSLAGCFYAGGAPLTEEQLQAFTAFAVTYGTIQYNQEMLQENAAQLNSQKADASEKMSAGAQKIADGKAELINGQKELDANKAELSKKQTELKDGKIKLAKAKEELSDAEKKLTDGQKELDTNRAEYDKSIADAQEKLTDAKVAVSEISKAKWYIWDRNDNESFSGIKSDMDFVQAVTTAFPVIFFLVAVLICLTTMTRMVEEDRGLIGTYKSLGYSNLKISLKYMIYAIFACILGGLFGSVIGFVGLPMVIRIIFKVMYVLPLFQLNFYPLHAIFGFGLFTLGIVGATAISCTAMLHHRPSELMRPKSPKAGSRILLERFPFIWKRLNFLGKVTCRNLFRYKKRAIMTIIGILGCTMLIVLGFGLRDTVGGLMSDQYDTVTVYDAIVVTDNLKSEEMNAVIKEWSADKKVDSALELQISTMTLQSKKDHTEITVMVIPDEADLDQFVHLQNSKTGENMALPSNGIVVTKSAAKQLSINGKDTISLLNEDNIQHDLSVAFVNTNYAGNYIYVSETYYQSVFNDYHANAFLLNLKDDVKGQIWLEDLKGDDRIVSVNSSQGAWDSYNAVNIDMVIYLLIGMSAVLAFAVLFTLSNINISERDRELATIKVLGFKPKEVCSYVNKETVILSLIGIILGLPAGYGMTYGILGNLSIADISFQVRVSLQAYLIAAVLTLTFTLLVNKVTNKELRKINMVEALKSVE